MAPPKKDAFADLFQSVSTPSNRKKNLADLHRERVGGSTSDFSKPLTPLGKQNNWDEFEIFSSPSLSSNNSRGSTPDDPFAGLDVLKPQQPVQQPQPNRQPVHHAQLVHHISLLDDEFTDAFVPEPVAEPVAKSVSVPEPAPVAPSRPSSLSRSSSAFNSRPSRERDATDERDEIIAQLLDIGFPVDVSLDAIDAVGLDLQACVNHIMSGGQKRTSGPRGSHPHEKEDFGAKLNEFSTDFFNKASFFLNKSKDAVIKNIEQFQNAQSGRGSPNNDLPAWMANQSEYKSKASERRANGEKYEDYGSDEDNIDQESIKRFIEEQKQRDKAKQKARMDQIKSAARDKLNGTKSTGNSSPERIPTPPQRPSSQPVRQATSSNSASGRSTPSFSRAEPKKVPIQKPSTQEADLLGLGTHLTPAEKFKQTSAEDQIYVSSRRRRPAPLKETILSTPKVPRKTTKEALDQFLQSDYDTGKEKASKAFNNGDYNEAYINYTKCLNALPQTHELRIIINSNVAITLIKLGSYKEARDHCNQGLDLINQEEINDSSYIINDKPIKFWYTKLLSRKAEALELTEAFEESLKCYTELVTQWGVNEKKVMDAKRRVNNIVNPPPKPAKKTTKATTKATAKPVNNETVRKVKELNKKQEDKENLKYKFQEQVQNKVFVWSNGKEDNLRALLTALPDILPVSLGFPFLTTKKITLGDLMLPKKVKINYMKVISSIHPDKLGNLNLNIEEEMLCQSVFITLNKSWDVFKEQNGIN